MSKVNRNGGLIYDSWLKMPLPPKKGNFRLSQYKKSNLWIFKSYEGRFGFLITGSLQNLKVSYKNIITTWRLRLTNIESNKPLKQCLIVESTSIIDSELFCSVFDYFFSQYDAGKVYTVSDIEEALDRLEDIILKDREDFNSVIGVWGELFLINKFLEVIDNEKGKTELISSWEGLKHRSKIDINIKSKGIKIEVKTTTDNIRMHHFNSMEQVSSAGSNLGLVASLCIYASHNGLTCLDLVLSIKAKLPLSCGPLIEERICIRGKECLNNLFRFELVNMRDLEFFEFSEIPKPSIEPGVSSIEWSAILDNKRPLNANEKQKLFCVLN